MSKETINIEKIEEFCNLVFVQSDTLDFDTFKVYIDDIISNGIEIAGGKHEIRFVVRTKVLNYIHDCRLKQLPFFAFASDSSYNRLRISFEDYYRNRYREINKTDSKFPTAFEHAFDYIQETIDSHTLFEEFSIQMTRNAVEYAKKEASEASESAMLSAKVSAETAKDAANQAASKAVDVAIEQVVKDKKMEGYAKNIIDDQINRVTKNISETSVTILGIFAGIVLTVVAGLFYSSSVIESANSTNFFRLLSVSSLVGFVCFNLIALMFRYIERIKHSGKCDFPRFSRTTIVISSVLLVIMIASGVLQFYIPDNMTSTNIEHSKIDTNITVSSDNKVLNIEDEGHNKNSVDTQNDNKDKDATN